MVNNICIRKEKAVRVYVDVIAKTFEENSEITQGGGRGGGVGGELNANEGRLTVEGQIIISKLFFANEYDFVVFLCLFTMCSFIVFFHWFAC